MKDQLRKMSELTQQGKIKWIVTPRLLHFDTNNRRFIIRIYSQRNKQGDRVTFYTLQIWNGNTKQYDFTLKITSSDSEFKELERLKSEIYGSSLNNILSLLNKN